MRPKEMMTQISRGTVEIISPDLLEKKLRLSQDQNRPLCVKAGFDPTAPDIHLGHIVLLRKLRQFQELGHRVCFLIGDFTAQVGDPTGRDQLRPKMGRREISQNAKTYKSQVFKILDPDKTEVVFNSTWLKKLKIQEMLELTAFSTVAQMLARADFKKRFEGNREISLLEFIYPLLQGYDSVYLKADIELGGTDQKFNLLMGRQLQVSFGQEPQVVIMTPLLEGTDGCRKMSKSFDNYIGINESPDEIMGKIMSISDDLMMRYYEILTNTDLKKIKAMHPKEAKLQLGESIISQFYQKEKARHARTTFDRVFRDRGAPQVVKEYKLNSHKAELIIDILVNSDLANSKNEARRLFKQGAVSHEGIKITDEHWSVKPGMIKVGKHRFLRLR